MTQLNPNAIQNGSISKNKLDTSVQATLDNSFAKYLTVTAGTTTMSLSDANKLLKNYNGMMVYQDSKLYFVKFLDGTINTTAGLITMTCIGWDESDSTGATFGHYGLTYNVTTQLFSLSAYV